MSTKSKKKGQMVWVAGTILVVLGVVLLSVGLASFFLAVPPCAINACPPIFSGYYAVYWSGILAGLVMIALGIGLVLQARRIQSSLAAQHSTSATSSSAPSLSPIFGVPVKAPISLP